MKKYLLICLIFLAFNNSPALSESYIVWGSSNANTGQSGTTLAGTSYNCGATPGGRISRDIFSVNIDTGVTSLIKSWVSGNVCVSGDPAETVAFGSGTNYDGATGLFYDHHANGTVKVWDLNNNATLVKTYPAFSFSGGGTRDVNGIGNIGQSKIIDSNGNTFLEKKADGSVHIGENSLVTQEVNGVQQLYATDANGDQIDINIKSGTNLLIDGTNITSLSGSGSAVSINTSNIAANTAAINNLAVDLSGSVALSSALAALPNASPDAFYTCGLGTGIHDSSSALSAGCASDFSNYAFVDKMPKIFQTASFNIGSSFLMNGEPDISEARDMSIKAGITFKFGSVKPTRVTDDRNYMLENKIDSVMEENKILKAQLKEENDVIRQENNLLKAQIVEINAQLKALNMLAMN